MSVDLLKKRDEYKKLKNTEHIQNINSLNRLAYWIYLDKGDIIMLFELNENLFNNILLSIKRNIFIINIVYDSFNQETYKKFKHILNRIRYIGYHIDILRVEKGVITISWRYK